MTKFTVYVRRTMLYGVEIEADTPEDADVRTWDKVSAGGIIDAEDTTVIDSDDIIEYITDEQGQMYFPNRQGTYNRQL